MGKKNDAELLECFRTEAEGYLLVLDKGIRRLDSEPADISLLEELLRIAHTMKGSAAIVNLTIVNTIARRIEDVLKEISRKDLDPDQEAIDTLLFMLGAVGMVLGDIPKGKKDRSSLLQEVEDRFEALLLKPVAILNQPSETEIQQVDSDTMPPPPVPQTDTTAPHLTTPPSQPSEIEPWTQKKAAQRIIPAAHKVTYWWEEPLEPMPLDAKKLRLKIMSKAVSMGLIMGFVCGAVVGIWAYNYWKTHMEQPLAISEITTAPDQVANAKPATAQEVRKVLDDIRKANLAKEIDQFMDNFSKDFAGYTLKREQMMATWQGFDFISLTYSLKKVTTVSAGAKATVVWNFTVKDKVTYETRKFKITHFITFKRQGEGLRIIALRQQDSG